MEFRDEIALTGEQSEVGLSIRATPTAASGGSRVGPRLAPRTDLALRLTGSWSWNAIRSWTQFYDVYDQNGEWAGSTSRSFGTSSPSSLPVLGNLLIEGSPLPGPSRSAPRPYVAESWLEQHERLRDLDALWWKVDLSATVDISRFVKTGSPRLEAPRRQRPRRPPDLGERLQLVYATREPAGAESLAGIPYFIPMATRTWTVVLDLGF